jgi:alkyl hydroperoxide reductase subunit AhpF
VAALSQWVEKSKKMDQHKDFVEESIEHCPLCGKASNTFSSHQGYLRHVGWCRNKLAEKMRAEELRNNPSLAVQGKSVPTVRVGVEEADKVDTYSSGRKRRVISETAEQKRMKLSIGGGGISSRALRQGLRIKSILLRLACRPLDLDVES